MAKRRKPSSEDVSVVESKASSGLVAAPALPVAGRRYIGLYGPPKGRKTTACASLDARWIVNDKNCLATLEDQHPNVNNGKVHLVDGYAGALATAQNFLEVAESEGAAALQCEAVILDSLTETYDDLESITPGTDFKHWNAVIEGMKALNNVLTKLSKFVHVIVIAHAPPKADTAVEKKGEWAILSITSKAAEIFARSFSWLVYIAGGSFDFKLQVQPVGVYVAAASAKDVDLTKVVTGDLRELMVEANLLE